MIREFLSTTKASNYRNLVDMMLQNFQGLGARITIKLHHLFGHLDYFAKNLGDVSEEQEEKFHQDINNDGRKTPRLLGLSHDGRLLLDMDP